MTNETVAPKSADWLETFKQQYDLAKIPETSRDDFDDFLLQRAAIRDYYLGIPAERFNEGIGAGDSPRTELIHHVALSYMDRDALIQAFDTTSIQMYNLFAKPETESKNVQLPYGKTMTGVRLLRKVVQHEALHTGFGVQFGNYLGVSRPAAMKRAWG